MLYQFLLNWVYENPLALVTLVLTLILVAHSVLEKDLGIRLTKKYRNSVFEAQSKIFLNASEYLISGERDLAIREFLSAVSLNRETLQTYFALGRLFRTNGQIDKAIGIHSSLVSRSNISDETRLIALRELAVDFEKGGILDRAIETYKDILKIDKNNPEIIKSLCHVLEDLAEWDEAYHYRLMLSKVSDEDQGENLSHILGQRALEFFHAGQFKEAIDHIEDSMHYYPSVSAKILQLKLYIIKGGLEDAKSMLLDLIQEYPMFASFIIDSIGVIPMGIEHYKGRVVVLKEYFLQLKDVFLDYHDSILLAQVDLLKEKGRASEALERIECWPKGAKSKKMSDLLYLNYLQLLAAEGQYEKLGQETNKFISSLVKKSLPYFCKSCGHESKSIFWRCSKCRKWETICFREFFSDKTL